ncbi:DUF4360 domain-containing protein [Actinoplanes sp. NEAU-A12]|uniref:DUF4360 domain-containing protein n=1 Tax=Actinoplanes sandaracinus TaxID=3045177 RepID=A0ABT6WCL2_9ACTN|nr:DUF4360 domain-containing protein [Actinoplanes sandaracinus]MDI6097469.1 DUF4360 domain-containing protein [Actinoplanes sandaracinus]
MPKRTVTLTRVVAAALAAALTIPLGGPAQGAPRANGATTPAAVTLEVLASNGSGCAPGTATVTADADDTGFRVRYRDFVAEAGGGAEPVDRRKNCQLSVLVNIPAGWTVAIAEADYRGRAHLRHGATGLHRTNYYWQGSSGGDSSNQSFSGPFSGAWSTWDVAPVLHYAPCSGQRVLNINTELRVDSGDSTGTSSMSMRSSEGDVHTLFNFSWGHC